MRVMKYIFTFFIFFFLFSNLNAETSNKELGKKALKTIVSEIRNPDSDIRMLSCDILGKIGNKAAVKLLKNRLNDVSKHVQISAAEALYTLGDKSALKTILHIINDVPGKKPIANTALLQMKIISRNKIREKAIEAVVRILEDNSRDLLYSLKNDSYGIIRDAAARELAMLGEISQMPNFFYALENEDEAIRYSAALSFSKICSEGSIAPLKAAFEKETSMRVKIAILDSFLCISDKRALKDTMLKLSSSSNPTIKFKAVLALSDIKSKKVFTKMNDIYSQSQDLGLRLAAMKGMSKYRKKPDTNILNPAFYSDSTEIKMLALDIIRDVDINDAMLLLANALEDKDYQVKLNAARQIVERLAKPSRGDK